MTSSRQGSGEIAASFFDDPSHYLLHNTVIALRRSLVHELLGDLQGDDIVDIGCGDGSLSLQYIDGAKTITLVDNSETMLQAARSNLLVDQARKVSLHHLDVTEEPLPIDSATVVLLVGVLGHLREPDIAMARAAALLEPGGRLVVQVTDSDRLMGRVLFLLGRIVCLTRGYRPSQLKGREVQEWARSSGLTLAAIKKYPMSPPGYRKLPITLQLWLFRAINRWWILAPLRTETLFLFLKDAF